MAKVNDFASELTERYGLSVEDADGFIAMMFDVISEELDSPDKQVKVKGLGTFKVTSVGARASVDVNTGERIVLEGRNKISFTPDVALRDRVNRPFAQFETVVLNDGVDFSEIDREFDEDKEEVTDAAMGAAEIAVEEHSTDENVVQDDSAAMESSTANEPVEDTEDSRQDAESVESVDGTMSVNETGTVELEAETGAVESDNGNPANTEDDAPSAAENEPDKGLHDEPESEPQCEPVCKQRNPRVVYWLTAASFALLVGIGIGMYFLYRQMESKNEAIEQLQNRLAVHAEKQKREAMHQAKPTPVPQKEERLRPVAEEPNEKAPQGYPSNEKESTGKDSKMKEPSVDEKAEKAATAAAPDYSKDVRIRTGAYVIVGTETTVTVRKGQTLASISKANLGPGMECYVEAYNNKTEVKVGDKLKIPKLKLKKHH